MVRTKCLPPRAAALERETGGNTVSGQLRNASREVFKGLQEYGETGVRLSRQKAVCSRKLRKVGKLCALSEILTNSISQPVLSCGTSVL